MSETHTSQSPHSYPLLSEAERHQLLVEWNDTQAEYPNKCIHQLFSEQVDLTPDATAVIFPEGGSRQRVELTYRELNNRSNQLAHHLQKLGVAPETLVGICMERSPEMMIGLLAILKAGGAYVPLDPAYPKERLAFMLRDAQVAVLLTQEKLVAEMEIHTTAKIVTLDSPIHLLRSDSDVAAPSVSVTPENLAYLIYTSGSTGRPKSVEGLHRGVINRFYWMWETYPFEAGEVVCQKTSLSFVDSVWETFGPLLRGIPLVIVNDAAAKDPQQLVQILSAENVTRLVLVPSLLNTLLRMFPDLSSRLPNLKILISSGETLSIDLFRRFQQMMPDRILLNLYGSSEVSADATWYDTRQLDQIENLSTIPIGRPISNMQVHILDPNLQPLPVGATGEIYIGGVGLARGYREQPELTKERFILNPMAIEEGSVRASNAPDVLYNTGDLGRYLPDGNIEYMGRKDYQVKVRGFRVELGEIEVVLKQHPTVQESIVVAQAEAGAESNADKRLIAYIVPEQVDVEDQSTQVSQWQDLWNHTYSQGTEETDPLLNISGWNDSYTGQPIPAEQMREWVDQTVDRVFACNPKRVLEIGCGTGMLLFRMAPQCDYYCGTDFASEALRYVEPRLGTLNKHVVLRQCAADDFSSFTPDEFDTVVINSVSQLLPSINYLADVLEKASNAVQPGGTIYIGDVRSLPLLEAFHAGVHLHQAPDSLPKEQLQQRIQRSISNDKEVVIHPDFFMALAAYLPKITHVQFQLRRSHAHNEMACFRYDVFLYIGHERPLHADVEPEYLKWEGRATLPALHQILAERQPDLVTIKEVPNARVLKEAKLLDVLAQDEDTRTVGDLREKLEQLGTSEGVEPEEFWALQDELPYRINVAQSESRIDAYDVMCSRSDLQVAPLDAAYALERPHQQETVRQPWATYANNPLEGQILRELQPQWRQYLVDHLPEYMVPSAFVALSAFPLTPSGKIDRLALPAPKTYRPELTTVLVVPQTEIEQQIAAVWRETLQLEMVGIHDNFFELGGHSILLTEVYNKLTQLEGINSRFGPEITIMRLFEFPTIHGLAQFISDSNPSAFNGETSSQSPRSSAKSDRASRQTQTARLRQRRERTRPVKGGS